MRVSAELVRVTVDQTDKSDPPPAAFLKRLAASRINVPFMSLAPREYGRRGLFCVAERDFHHATRLLDLDHYPKQNVEITAKVATIMIYPHRNSLAVPGIVLRALGRARLPVYGVGSSISAVTVLTDHERLEEAVCEILRDLDLGPGHAPFHQEPDLSRFRFEMPRMGGLPGTDDNPIFRKTLIPVYDIRQSGELALVSLSFDKDDAGPWGERVRALGEKGAAFTLAIAQAAQPDYLNFMIIADAARTEDMVRDLDKAARETPGAVSGVLSPVELLCMYGPHFEERYGIADAAVSLLDETNGLLLGACCTGTSVYLLVPGTMGRLAAQILATRFVVPGARGADKGD
ncbi:MAG: hypothetical protein ACLFOY_05120 [Desulfatibacillaceae bacterium]